jgi:undecaprenyl pyrophosphate phosphatase UppP
VMAAIIALRNLYLITTEFSFGFYLDNYTNAEITNEKFVIVMVIGGGLLILWGYFKKSKDDEKDTYDEDGWRSFDYSKKK